MAKNTKISWAKHTVNFWWGCTWQSPACDNCYAEEIDRTYHPAEGPGPSDTPKHATYWGPDAPRWTRFEAARKEALKFNRAAKKEGRRDNVFVNSMSDFFEGRSDLDQVRLGALEVFMDTPNIVWMLLTKRPGSILGLLERALLHAREAAQPNTRLISWLERWLEGTPPDNIWVGTTVEGQAWAEQRIPALLKVPAILHFLSCEPLLERVDLTPWIHALGWVIVGGESGHNARPVHPDWVRAIRDLCRAAGIPFQFKQWGQWRPVEPEEDEAYCCVCGCTEDLACKGGCHWVETDELEDRCSQCVGLEKPKDRPVQFFKMLNKEDAGRELDGEIHDEYPIFDHAC